MQKTKSERNNRKRQRSYVFANINTSGWSFHENQKCITLVSMHQQNEIMTWTFYVVFFYLNIWEFVILKCVYYNRDICGCWCQENNGSSQFKWYRQTDQQKGLYWRHFCQVILLVNITCAQLNGSSFLLLKFAAYAMCSMAHCMHIFDVHSRSVGRPFSSA